MCKVVPVAVAGSVPTDSEDTDSDRTTARTTDRPTARTTDRSNDRTNDRTPAKRSTTTASSAKGPLGPTWQPIYDAAYSVAMQTFNLPHLSLFSSLAIAYYAYTGYLQLTPLMPLVAIFGMARVPFVGFCMSNALHRYFAHGAFSTSRPFQFVIGLVGSMALQGGVLWWASKHLRHHKHCDEPRDPHSPTQSQSNMYAWLGWMYCETHHDWVYLPKRLLVPELLFLNLFFFLPNFLVTLSLVPWVGKEWALFLCWVPGLFGSLATTRFNVDYHPMRTDRKEGECAGINRKSGDKGIGPIRLEWLAVYAPWMFEPLVGEAYHDDHHHWPKRAHRPGYDMPYRLVLAPLARVGLIWDLQQPLPTDTFYNKSTGTGSGTTTSKAYPILDSEKED